MISEVSATDVCNKYKLSDLGSSFVFWCRHNHRLLPEVWDLMQLEKLIEDERECIGQWLCSAFKEPPPIVSGPGLLYSSKTFTYSFVVNINASFKLLCAHITVHRQFLGEIMNITTRAKDVQFFSKR